MSSQKKLPILCLDFDGVLHGYQSGWQGAAIIPDPPVPGAVQFLHGAVERFQVAVYSSRSGQPGGIDAMRGWLMMWLMAVIEDRREAEHVFSLIQWPTEKPAAIVTIDDRAIQFTGEWPSLDEIVAFQPWNKRPAAVSAEARSTLSAPTEAGGAGGNGWRSIEMAPRDGTLFLAFERGRGRARNPYVCWWEKSPSDGAGYWQDDADSEPAPTHWQPSLPEPTPADAGAEGGQS